MELNGFLDFLHVQCGLTKGDLVADDKAGSQGSINYIFWKMMTQWHFHVFSVTLSTSFLGILGSL